MQPTPSILLCLLSTIIGISTPHEVLMLVPFGSISHKNLFMPIATALGSRGHNVTVVSVFKPTETSKNVHEIVIPAIADLNRRLQNLHIRVGQEGPIMDIIFGFAETTRMLCDEFFKLGLMQDWIKTSRRFDSVLIDSVMAECLLPPSQLLSHAIGFLNTCKLLPWMSYPMNIPTPYSVQPFVYNDMTTTMSFWERALNAFRQTSYQEQMHWVVYAEMDKAVKKHFPNAKTIIEAFKDVSLILVNSNPVLTAPRPEAPNIINVGGMHLKPGKPLEHEIAKLAESAKEHGFVYFSLGSIFEDILTKEHIQTFIDAFAQLKYKIIWRLKKKINVKLPENVVQVAWVPQQDLLAHPNIRAFISHAGLLSLQEAFYNGVPTVTLPLFAEQSSNAAHLSDLKLTIRLKWEELNAERIVKAVKTACEDEELRLNMKNASKVINDILQPPLETAVYWLEHVMRHEGGHHLALRIDLSILQYFMIDVVCCWLGSAFGFGIFLWVIMVRLFGKRKKSEVKVVS